MPLVPVGESEIDLQMKNKFENNENAYLCYVQKHLKIEIVYLLSTQKLYNRYA